MESLVLAKLVQNGSNNVGVNYFKNDTVPPYCYQGTMCPKRLKSVASCQ